MHRWMNEREQQRKNGHPSYLPDSVLSVVALLKYKKKYLI